MSTNVVNRFLLDILIILELPVDPHERFHRIQQLTAYHLAHCLHCRPWVSPRTPGTAYFQLCRKLELRNLCKIREEILRWADQRFWEGGEEEIGWAEIQRKKEKATLRTLRKREASYIGDRTIRFRDIQMQGQISWSHQDLHQCTLLSMQSSSEHSYTFA